MAEKPNIIFVMPDQLRADFLGCYDASFIDTPNIDALADHGVIYGNAYSAHPVCVPARVSLMTGMNASGLATWPEILSENGYYTVGIGKMHFYPWEINLGFQHRVIAEDKVWIHIRDDYDVFLRAHGYEKNMGHERVDYQENYGAFLTDLPWEYSVDHFVGQEATRWIENYPTTPRPNSRARSRMRTYPRQCPRSQRTCTSFAASVPSRDGGCGGSPKGKAIPTKRPICCIAATMPRS